MYCENRAKVFISRNLVHHGRRKHIELKQHYIRDIVSKKIIFLKQCSIDDQIANIMTKALLTNKFCYFQSLLGVYNFESLKGIE